MFNSKGIMNKYLLPTHAIDSDASIIVQAMERITTGCSNDREKAVAIHNFVRDEIQFGWTKYYDRMKASQVLRMKKGFCNTKSILFIALLRAANIPARLHIVSIHSDILQGIIDPKVNYLDHAYSEVLIDGNWLALDSYVLDKQFFQFAQNKLKETKKIIGYGTYLDAEIEWNGRSDNFTQFMDNHLFPHFTNKDHGVFIDLQDFYNIGKPVYKQNWLEKFFFPLLISPANRNIRQVRDFFSQDIFYKKNKSSLGIPDSIKKAL